MSFSAVKVYVTLGGPTVWIDTYRESVELRWANEESRYFLTSDVIESVNDIFEEIYNSCR